MIDFILSCFFLSSSTLFFLCKFLSILRLKLQVNSLKFSGCSPSLSPCFFACDESVTFWWLWERGAHIIVDWYFRLKNTCIAVTAWFTAMKYQCSTWFWFLKWTPGTRQVIVMSSNTKANANIDWYNNRTPIWGELVPPLFRIKLRSEFVTTLRWDHVKFRV